MATKPKTNTPKAKGGALRPARQTLVMATSTMAVSMRLGGAAAEPASEAVPHDKLIAFARALARDAARADYAAERRLAMGE